MAYINNVVVNTWLSMCTPCIVHITDFQEDFRKKGEKSSSQKFTKG